MMTLKNIIIFSLGWGALSACGGAEHDNGHTHDKKTVTQQTRDIENTGPYTALKADTSPQNSDVRQADSHTHGDANLAVVIEGTTLTIELETPLFNLTGFEHAPEMTDEIVALEAAEAKLQQPSALFLTNYQAKCTSTNDDLAIHLEADDHKDDEHGDDDHHDDHGDDDHHENGEVHQDVLITYTFQCAAPQSLSTIDIALLKSFPNMTDLDVTYLGSDTQRFFELDQTNTNISLRP